MTQKQAIQLFEDRKVRTVWDERTETWYFSVLDVISALTDTVNPTDYFKKMRKRDEALASFVGTNCPQIAMRSETGVMRKTLAGDVKTVLRIIQSIPSQKAEPFKQWMAQVASDRLDQMSLIGRKGWYSKGCALTWRRQDTRCSRTLFRLAVSALPTVGTDAGLLPTVQTQGLKRCVNGRTEFMPTVLLPTPHASDASRGGQKVTGLYKTRKSGLTYMSLLNDLAVSGLLPTPTANDAKNVTLPASQGICNGLPKTAMQSDEYRTGTGSRLNPLYVAEMMGFPGNWLVSPFLGGAGKPSKPAVTP